MVVKLRVEDALVPPAFDALPRQQYVVPFDKLAIACESPTSDELS